MALLQYPPRPRVGYCHWAQGRRPALTLSETSAATPGTRAHDKAAVAVEASEA